MVPLICTGELKSTFKPPRKERVSIESPRTIPPVLSKFVLLVTVVLEPRNCKP